MRWSRFKNNDAREINEVISRRIFPAVKNMKNGHLPDFDEKGEMIEVQEESSEQQESTAFARYMSDAMFRIPTAQVTGISCSTVQRWVHESNGTPPVASGFAERPDTEKNRSCDIPDDTLTTKTYDEGVQKHEKAPWKIEKIA